jgi:antitoxin component of RelBE/YafQ-DinJ toxin-antitoxin module|tara:strand:- start:331 stop:507 length:177 start_codon:yes stop_codon:yes gene_type:complete
MKLPIERKKANTSAVVFRIDPDTKKKLTALKKHYGVGTGELMKVMIVECHKSLAEIEQ